MKVTRKMRRGHTPGHPTALSKGEDMVQSTLKEAGNCKESCNILYAGERVGPTKKGAKSYLAERVFVSPDQLWLDRTEPDGIDMVVGHVSGPQGPRSTLGYHEYVSRAELTFDVLVTKNSILPEWWPELWQQMQEIGLGALRSQGYGRFDIEQWDEIEPTTAVPAAFRKAAREPVAAR